LRVSAYYRLELPFSGTWEEAYEAFTALNSSARNIRERWSAWAKDKASMLAFYDYPAKNSRANLF